MTQIILDIATAPIADAATYIEGAVKAPAHYKDEAKIADYVREKEAERLAMAATDVDLARITGVGIDGVDLDEDAGIWICPTDDDERSVLTRLSLLIRRDYDTQIITYGGFNFDLPCLMRRAQYLGVRFPKISLDRYRSPHRDLCEELSDRNPQRRRPLCFYVKRLGWTDLTKPLSGAEEARVHETHDWDGLRASLQHDLTATGRLAMWMGVVTAESLASVAEARA